MPNVTPKLFAMGQILATPGAIAAIDESGDRIYDFLDRHAKCDWGDVCEDDKQANNEALLDGSRILSAYRTSKGVKVWIITEAVDDEGLRAATTLLLPEEY